jgi:AcrR family transcriptional regulator
MRLAAPDRKKQLIDIAMKLFSEQGFDGTSAREITKIVGINEAIIFCNFRSKEDLYRVVLTNLIKSRGRNRRIRVLLKPGSDLCGILVSIAEILLDRRADDASVNRLLFYSALCNRELSDPSFQTYAHELQSNFIRQSIGEGQIHAVEPVVARGHSLERSSITISCRSFSDVDAIKRFPSVNWRKK